MSPCKVVDMTQVGFALASFPPVHRKRKESNNDNNSNNKQDT
jgi:hypothetical protein